MRSVAMARLCSWVLLVAAGHALQLAGAAEQRSAAAADRITHLPGLPDKQLASLPPMFAGVLPAAANATLRGSLFYWLCESSV